jgi:hypothetical protein
VARLRTKGISSSEVNHGWLLTRFRWADGRKYWAGLIQTSRNLARIIWVHIDEREGEENSKVDLLRKLYIQGPIWSWSYIHY